jgi:hypothetical protein
MRTEYIVLNEVLATFLCFVGAGARPKACDNLCNLAFAWRHRQLNRLVEIQKFKKNGKKG